MPDNLGNKIVQDKAMVAREGLYETRRIIAAVHRERGQLQTGDPAFGAGLQSGHISFGERETHDLRQELRGFGEREAHAAGVVGQEIGAPHRRHRDRVAALAGPHVHAR
ncbi:MAG TPA: hypothetical protein PK954_19805, partial [Anaerolineales bacterium]|nr:hypothetical protein [Anaerolineales bacterium]